ncbi:MAG: type IX secretion system membrane protein PorP/SprF [Elusimicrobia bacterium]|nr:type IX secretion system membrane protein PorP/SprF [Elusimicrobiota bacterium]
MSRRARAALALTLVLASLPRPARAAYDDVGVSARATGLGTAYTAVADDVYSVYYNPAGLATLDRREFGTSYTRLLTGLSDGSNIQNSFLAYAHPLAEGRNGTVGAAFNYFTLDSLYRESSLFASYGRMLTREDRPDPVFVGASAKFLNRSLGGTSVASNSLSNTGVATGGADPVLAHTSKTNFDGDLGVLWRVKPRWNLGLEVQHALEPNVAFSPDSTDKLGRNIKLGGAYRTPFTTLSSDVGFLAAPDGSMDKRVSVAAEKWLPTLLYGSFGVRGGIGFGSRDYRQLATGVSYKIHRMQFDYGFAIPVGGLTQTAGTHRVGLTWRFGAPRQADQLLGDMLLENLAAAAPVGTPEFDKQAAELVAYKRKAIDLLMRDADAEAQLGRFSNAHERSRQAASLAPKDPVLAGLDERYRTAAAYFPDISADLREAPGAATHDGVMKFIAGKDQEALASLANARALKPSAALDGLIRVLEAKLGAPAPVVSTAAAVAPAAVAVSSPAAAAPAVAASSAAVPSGADALKRILESTSALMEVSFFQQEWDKVVKLADQVIAMDPGNLQAYKRQAGAYHALKKHAEALKSLRAAYALETDEAERAKLKSYIAAMKAVVDKESRPAVAQRPARPAGGPEDVEKLYEAGVELYAQGRLLEAREAFRRCLQIDENYAPAQRAYQRVQAEMMQTGKDR